MNNDLNRNLAILDFFKIFDKNKYYSLYIFISVITLCILSRY